MEKLKVKVIYKDSDKYPDEEIELDEKDRKKVHLTRRGFVRIGDTMINNDLIAKIFRISGPKLEDNSE